MVLKDRNALLRLAQALGKNLKIDDHQSLMRKSAKPQLIAATTSPS
jgi:hypothetical protein